MKRTVGMMVISVAVLILVLWLFPGTVQTTEAAAEGDYTYEITDGMATVTGYIGAGGNVTIPNTLGGYPVASIRNYAFYNCDSLTNVTIPNDVTSIGIYAFSGCSSLTNITIGDSVESIEVFAFAGCSSLTNIAVSAKNAAYTNKNGVLFNKDLTVLVAYPGGRAGAYTIPNSVTNIGEGAFCSCSSLTSVTIPESVTSIGLEAFSDCSSLMSIMIPESVASIGGFAFQSCSRLTSIAVSKENTVYTSQGGVLFNKDLTVLVAYPGGRAGAYGIPDSVTNIGEGAFCYCDHLTSVTLPDGVTSIGSTAFFDCDRLTSVTIPDSVTSIGYYAFYNTALYNDENNWTGGVLHIDNCLIKAQSYVVFGSYTIREGTQLIADSAFASCDHLTSVTIPDSVTSIGDYAFEDCSSLTSVTIPDSVTSIGGSAFAGCISLTSVTIPDSVTSIGYKAFYGCSKLTSIAIGNGVTSIEYYAFYNTALYSDEDNWTDGVLYIDNCLIKAQSYAVSGSYTVREDTRLIAEAAFADCTNLTSITIPDSVTSIGEGSFAGCSNLASVTIGSGVTSIGGASFIWCNSLTSVTFAGNAPNIGDYAFADVITTVYYPANNPTWTAAVRQNYGGTLTWVAYEPQFTQISATLGADIGLNFYTDTKAASVTFTWNSGVGEQTVTLTGESTANGFRYTCPLTAKEIDAKVTAEIKNASGQTIQTYTYSTADYLQHLTEDEGYTPAEAALAQATLQYGAAAKAHFESGVPVDLPAPETIPTFFDKENMVTEDGEIAYYGRSLLLKDMVLLRLYFAAPEAPAIQVNGAAAEVKPHSEEGYYTVDIPVAAANLGGSNQITVDGTQIDFTVGVNDYIARALAETPASDTLAQLCRALYYYGVAAAQLMIQ